MSVQASLKSFTFGARADDLQSRGATAALVRELGDNYAGYHRSLADRLAALGRPERATFDSADAFLEAYARVEQIVLAEVTLRACRAFRVHGRALDAALDLSVPLLDADDRLVDVERGKAG